MPAVISACWSSQKPRAAASAGEAQLVDMSYGSPTPFTAITLLADLPGIEPERITIDLRDGVLTLTADTEPPMGRENETPLLVEYQTGRYRRQFTLSDVIDQAQIDAKCTDGVLRLTLPKVAKATPRKISVQAG